MKRRETKRKQIYISALLAVLSALILLSGISVASSAALSPSDALTREEVTAEMNSRYSKIFSFVSGDNISLQAQTTADDSGNMVADDAIISLSADITETSSTDLQKAEAIYIWIVENIYFDSDYANGITTETNVSASDVFENRYAAGEGFANLYAAMCHSVGVPCRRVTGFVPPETSDDNIFFNEYFKNEANHSWNEVYVNHSWIVADPARDCKNIYSSGTFSAEDHTLLWFGTDFDDFSATHMGLGYSHTFSSEALDFTISEGKITAQNYKGTSTEFVVPEGVDIVKLLNTNKNITSVALPSTLSEISDNTFKDCKLLTTAAIPEGVKIIGKTAFSGCSSVDNIVLPKSLESLGQQAFNKCTALKSIAIPNLVEIIMTGTFNGCTSLESAVIGDGVTEIMRNSFQNCTALKTIDIGTGVTDIGANAFSGCTSLETITGAENVSILRNNAFLNCTVLGDCDFFNNLTRMEYNAIKGCAKITEITIPYTYTYIYSSNFVGCTSLKKVVIEGNLLEIRDKAFYECESLETINLPSTVTSIGKEAFYGCTALKSVDLPDGLTSLEDLVFCGCSSLQSIGEDIPSSVTYIGTYAFYDCSIKGKLTIPDGITEIPDYAFYSCRAITEITIPESVTVIGNSAFTRVNSLTDIYYLGTRAQWNSGVSIGTNNTRFLQAVLHCIDDVHEHEYTSSVTTMPTCITDGVRTYVCGCGDSYTETVEKTGHKEITVPGVKASCTATGLSDGVSCSVCSAVLVPQTITNKLDHTESDWITDTPATCKTEGVKHTECTVCGTQLSSGTINKLPHTETEIPSVDATCTSTGLTSGVKCSACDEIIAPQTVIGKLDHTESEWITDTPATCKSEGVKHTECTLCGTQLSSGTISKLPHTETEIPAVAATCTSTGLTSGVKCSVCDEIIVEQTTTSKLSHTESDWITDTPATCKTEGVKHTECTLCGTRLSSGTINKLPHTETEIPSVDATCTSTGLTSGVKCSVCDEIIVAQTTTSKLSHTESDWITDTPATCKTEGVKHTQCTVCGTQLSSGTISKLPHTEEVMPQVNATCVSYGLTQGKKCSVCDYVIIPQTQIEKRNHTDNDGDNSCDICGTRLVSDSPEKVEPCSHICHEKGFMGFIWSVIRIFLKIFGVNQSCECGARHY